MSEQAARISSTKERAPHLRDVTQELPPAELYAIRTQTVKDREIVKAPVERFRCKSSSECTIQTQPYSYTIGRENIVVNHVRQVLVHAEDCLVR